jgi:hypothetical protein
MFTNQEVSHASLITIQTNFRKVHAYERHQFDVNFVLLQRNVYEKSERHTIGNGLPKPKSNYENSFCFYVRKKNYRH